MRSIRTKLLGLLAPWLAVLIVSVGVFLDSQIERALTGQFDESLAQSARVLAGYVELDPDYSRTEYILDMDSAQFPEYEPGPTPAYFEVRYRDGSLVTKSHSLAGEVSLEIPEGVKELDSFSLELPDGRHGRAIRVSAKPIIDPEDWEGEAVPEAPFGPVTIIEARSREEIDRTLQRIRASMILLGPIVFLVTLVCVAWVVHRGLDPLRTASAQAETMDSENLNARFVLEEAPAEILPLLHSLNRLLMRLEESFEREQAFTNAVAHEIRTPLAELRAVAEMQYEDANAAGQEALSEVLEISTEMHSLLEALMQMRRAELGDTATAGECVVIADLLNSLMDLFRARIQEKSLRFSIDDCEGASVECNLQMLKTILFNLLSNAVEYAPAGDEIRGSVHVDNEACLISIENAAPEITNADLERMFQSFWRKESSRQSRSHFGLGLTIAKSLAKCMEAQLSASLCSDRRLRMSLRIPAR